ncbi:MAG: hypothetical protein COV75_02985 [Candidatus Omnitrophica bacterium CG11_big_fil_rev_8_21_14_0_20_63_9]|nr:MAG: hypothetical protein COV75_02985 [Candidatus Omnitrophica bacterium CG11_big_fil_rev_8_21_14_0_20_63_9]
MAYGIGILLLSAVAGYWVLERSALHKGQLKRVGQFVGWLVIVVSVVGIACRVWCLASGNSGWCSMGKGWKGGYCPLTSKSAPGPAQAP